MKRRILAALAAVFFGALTTNHSSNAASNVTTYSGTYCKALHDSYTGYYRNDSYDYPDFGFPVWGIQETAVAFGGTVTCPVIVDEPDSLAGGKVWVYVLTKNKRDSVYCYLWSLRHNGSTAGSSRGGRYGTGWLLMNVSVEATNGSYLLNCGLPYRGMLTTIRVEEKR